MANNNGAPAPVLIVQTQAALAAAARLLPGYRALFDMGTSAPNAADWVMDCAGEDVALWPVNNPARISRANHLGACLAEICVRVRVIRPNGETPKGFDLGDLKTPEAALDYARAHVDVVARPLPLAALPPDDSTPDDPEPEGPRTPGRARTLHHDNAEPGSMVERWARWGLDRRSNGEPYANAANVMRCIQNDPRIAGRLWYDSFHQRVFTDASDGVSLVARREWSDVDDVRLLTYLQADVGLVKLTLQHVTQAVLKTAHDDVRNEPREWLDALRWDGVDRLAYVMSEGFGAQNTEYTQAVGRCWLMSMVARVMRPGCIAKALPVLEGAENIGKSKACALIGGTFFAEVHESVASKDFYQVIAGKLLVEIGELHAFRRADVERVKAVISQTTDRYRASYGRRAEDHPRQCVFVGTTNRTDWNASDTGACRFWPITCGALDMEWLAANREQLFAEARARYERGELWWDVPVSDAQREQDDRIDRDVWEATVSGFSEQFAEVTVADVLRAAIEKKTADTTRTDQMRVASILQINGWRKVSTRRNGAQVKVWRNPAPQATVAATSAATLVKRAEPRDDEIFTS